jgi:hypothetical protein
MAQGDERHRLATLQEARAVPGRGDERGDHQVDVVPGRPEADGEQCAAGHGEQLRRGCGLESAHRLQDERAVHAHCGVACHLGGSGIPRVTISQCLCGGQTKDGPVVLGVQDGQGLFGFGEKAVALRPIDGSSVGEQGLATQGGQAHAGWTHECGEVAGLSDGGGKKLVRGGIREGGGEGHDG